jgi:hypothetical protein
LDNSVVEVLHVGADLFELIEEEPLVASLVAEIDADCLRVYPLYFD